MLDTDQEVILNTVDGRLFECSLDTSISVLEFLPLPRTSICITDTQIAELLPIMWRPGQSTVGEVYLLSNLEKLNFRRGEYITLHLKGGKMTRFNMKDSHACAKYLQEQMKKIGKIGKTSLTPRKANIANNAKALFVRAKELEANFDANPSHKVVLQIVNILREATELIGEVSSDVDDESYKHIVQYFHAFLRRSDVIRLLDSEGHADNNKGRSSANKSGIGTKPDNPQSSSPLPLSTTQEKQGGQAVEGLTPFLSPTPSHAPSSTHKQELDPNVSILSFHSPEHVSPNHREYLSAMKRNTEGVLEDDDDWGLAEGDEGEEGESEEEDDFELSAMLGNLQHELDSITMGIDTKVGKEEEKIAGERDGQEDETQVEKVQKKDEVETWTHL
jgi:hypothetical protein